MKIERVRRALMASIVLLASCGAAPSNEPVEGEAWLSEQYFGDRDIATLPDLNERIDFGIGAWRKVDALGETAARDIFAYPLVLSHYFPEITFGGDLGKVPQHSFADPAQILDSLMAERSRAEAIVGAGKVRLATIQLAVSLDMRELAEAAAGPTFDVQYSSSRCAIIDVFGPKRQNRETGIFLIGKDGRWDLNDPVVERCLVGGIATVMGMNTRYVMAHADRLYPHVPARWSCAFAASGPQARKFLETLSFGPCRSDVRYSWPYDLLRTAVSSGKLPQGPIRREAFDAVLGDAAHAIGNKVRERVMREDAEAIAAARAASKVLPPIAREGVVAPRRQ